MYWTANAVKNINIKDLHEKDSAFLPAICSVLCRPHTLSDNVLNPIMGMYMLAKYNMSVNRGLAMHRHFLEIYCS